MQLEFHLGGVWWQELFDKKELFGGVKLF